MNFKRIVSTLLCASAGLTLASCGGEKEVKTFEYNLFPVVQKATYQQKTFNVELEKGVNLVLANDIPKNLKTRIKDSLTKFGFTKIKESNAISKEQFNLVVSLNTDNEVATLIKSEFSNVDQEIYSKYDSYNLGIKENTIGLLAKDIEACYCGLSTLNLILAETKQENYQFSDVIIADYSDTKYRGIVEGFYGTPWSNADRIRLIKYGAEYKMNNYTFAPKDDPYHSKKWKTLYPQQELKELKEVVDAANEVGVKFTWSIHPFMHDRFRAPGYKPLKYDDKGRPEYNPAYEEGSREEGKQKYLFDDAKEETETMFQNDLASLKAKFDQLYSIGVRSFSVGADDFSAPSGWNSRNTWDGENFHGRIMNEVVKWKETKTDADEIDLTFVPTVYTSSYLGWGAKYLDALGKTIPNTVNIQWTGDYVVSGITQSGVDSFIEAINKSITNEADKHKPYFWLNWPVNDYAFDTVLIGNGTNLLNPVDGLLGVQTNPMSQAELSKVALFQTLDYSWNIKKYEPVNSQKNAIYSLASNINKELLHVSDYLGSSYRGHLPMSESESFSRDFLNIKHVCNTLTETMFDHEKRDKGVDQELLKIFSYAKERLSKEMNALIKDTEVILSDSNKNTILKTELTPFAKGLKLVAELYLEELKIADSYLKNGKSEDLVKKLNELNSKYEELENIVVEQRIGEDPIKVRPGAKYLHPSTYELRDWLKDVLK